MKPITVIRIEYNDGYGIFFKKLWDKNGVPYAHRPYYVEKDLPELWKRHLELFNWPDEDNLDVKRDNKEYFCAFKSIEDFDYWITKDELAHLIHLGFKVLSLTVTDYQIGEHQVVYTKESIIKSKDITHLFNQISS